MYSTIAGRHGVYNANSTIVSARNEMKTTATASNCSWRHQQTAPNNKINNKGSTTIEFLYFAIVIRLACIINTIGPNTSS